MQQGICRAKTALAEPIFAPASKKTPTAFFSPEGVAAAARPPARADPAVFWITVSRKPSSLTGWTASPATSLAFQRTVIGDPQSELAPMRLALISAPTMLQSSAA